MVPCLSTSGSGVRTRSSKPTWLGSPSVPQKPARVRNVVLDQADGSRRNLTISDVSAHREKGANLAKQVGMGRRSHSEIYHEREGETMQTNVRRRFTASRGGHA